MKLTEFLLARLDRDEEIAEGRHIWNCPASSDYKGTTTGGRCECAQRHVLADLRAKRSIVMRANHYDNPTGDVGVEAAFDEAEQVCRILATVYSEHSSYDEAWRP